VSVEQLAVDAEPIALPASLGQQRLWFLDQVEPGTGRYNMGFALRIDAPLETCALRRALDEVVARHEALRTVFTQVDGQAVQVILPPAAVDLPVVDLAHLSADAAAAEATRVLHAELQRPYDLAAGPLFRALLVRLGDQEWRLLLGMHHIVVDEASLYIVLREVQQAYHAFASGLPSPLGDPPVQYADFALWQREMLQAGEMDRQLAWWRARMEGVSGVLELPTDRPRPAAPGWRGASIEFRTPAAVRAGLWELARQEGATPYVVLLALWQLLLGRLAGQDDVVVGTPVGGRTEETEDTVGFFVNTLAMRADLGGNPPFRAFLRRVREDTLTAFAHPDLPLERLVEALPLDRDPSRAPLFQTMFVLARAATGAGPSPDARWTPVPVELSTARFDLTLIARDERGVLHCMLDYALDLFGAETAERITRQFATLAAAVARNPELPIHDAPLLAPEERARLTGDWAGADGAYPLDVPIHRRIEAQAARTPDAPALMLGDDALTYGEMDARANRLAHRLLALGLAPEERVGIVADRSMEAVVSLLAVLKAGGAYVPIDPASPAVRAGAMVRDAGIRRVLGRAEHDEMVRGWGAEPVRADGAGEGREDAPGVDIHPDALAYVVYTSGSTGTPKGVMVRHRGLVNLALGFIDLHGFAPGDRVLLVPPLSFDATVGDVFPALAAGAALVLHPDPASLGADALLELCRAREITMVDTAAALWIQWSDAVISRGAPVDAAPLRMVMMGGEAAPLDRVAAWARATGGRVALMNHYGPTEATCCATLQRTVDGAEWRGASASIPIGRAVPGCRAYVLDRRGHPVDFGVPGELYLGGEGVARGYLDRPALTAERFVPDPFLPRPGARMYRTGDRVRRLGDGTLEFLGRTDHQIKLRGYRIEPAEVESALLSHPAVREALVTVREDPRKRLVAYVGAPGAAPAAAELREHVRGRLPEYMVPAAVVVLPALPVTRHGKVDRAALPAPEDGGDAARFVAPRTETERTLAALWADVLAVPKVGADDDFFELGGHSLLALPLVERVRQAFAVEVPLRALFSAPTVHRMAAAIDAVRAAGGGEVEDAGYAPPPEVYADLRLADGLRPAAPYAPRPLRSVFLTGATGFLGAYLLHGVLRRTTADVYCLVRAKDADEGRRRIAENVRGYLPWDESWGDRVIPVVGDLSAPRLGLTEDGFEALAERLDCIVHNGGVVNFTLPYGRMREANVLGTAEVLRLACARAAIPVHYVSTLGVHATRETQEVALFEDAPLPDVALVHDPYTLTKYVADVLVGQAGRRGVPVAIHRPARVGPDTRTGAMNPDDYLARVVRGIAETGIAPDLGWQWDLAPVEQVAAGIVQAVADPSWLGGAYHYFNPRLLAFRTLVDAVAQHGYPVQRLPYAEWRRRVLVAAADARHPLHPLLPLFPEKLHGLKAPHFHSSRADALLSAAGAAWTTPDAALVRRAVSYFVARGVLKGAPADAVSPETFA
jgi:amino acid adenylation domain-containing protein/thioester reductase-like protein